MIIFFFMVALHFLLYVILWNILYNIHVVFLSFVCIFMQIFSPYGHVEDIFFKSTHGWSLILSCYVLYVVSVALRNELVFGSVFYFLSNISTTRKEVADSG